MITKDSGQRVVNDGNGLISFIIFFPSFYSMFDANDINANIVNLWTTETVEDEGKTKFAEATELFDDNEKKAKWHY